MVGGGNIDKKEKKREKKKSDSSRMYQQRNPPPFTVPGEVHCRVDVNKKRKNMVRSSWSISRFFVLIFLEVSWNNSVVSLLWRSHGVVPKVARTLFSAFLFSLFLYMRCLVFLVGNFPKASCLIECDPRSGGETASVFIAGKGGITRCDFIKKHSHLRQKVINLQF